MSIEHGCNVIETSRNYSDGICEKVVGNVLSEMFENQLQREVNFLKICLKD